MSRFRTSHPLAKIFSGVVVDLPLPTNLTLFWNFGSLLGLVIMIQVVSGLFLALHYSCSVTVAFATLDHITRDVNYGWLLRTTHANGASFFFFLFIVTSGVHSIMGGGASWGRGCVG